MRLCYKCAHSFFRYPALFCAAAAAKFAKTAEKLGYDAVSAVAPFYYKFSFAEIKKYYYDIAESVDLPMLIYNFPNFSGVNLTYNNIGEFLCSDKFMGVKHTSNDYFSMERFKSEYPDKVIYNGFDEMFLAGISMGADGGIGSTYNFMAEKFIKMQSLFADGKISGAQKIQADVNKIVAALVKVGVMQGEKAVLCEMGLDFGIARAPFKDCSKEEKSALIKTVMPLL